MIQAYEKKKKSFILKKDYWKTRYEYESKKKTKTLFEL